MRGAHCRVTTRFKSNLERGKGGQERQSCSPQGKVLDYLFVSARLCYCRQIFLILSKIFQIIILNEILHCKLQQSKLVLVRLDVLETFNDRYEEFR